MHEGRGHFGLSVDVLQLLFHPAAVALAQDRRLDGDLDGVGVVVVDVIFPKNAFNGKFSNKLL